MLNKKGQTLVEYGVLLVVIAVLAVYLVDPLKLLIQALFTTAESTVTTAATNAAG